MKDDHSKKDITTAISLALGIQAIPEYKFHPKRKWSFDVAIPEHKIAIEIEGGSWNNGRHTRGSGYQKDMEKYNEAVRHGWKVLRITPQQVNSNYIIEILTELIWKEPKITTACISKACAAGCGKSKKK